MGRERESSRPWLWSWGCGVANGVWVCDGVGVVGEEGGGGESQRRWLEKGKELKGEEGLRRRLG